MTTRPYWSELNKLRSEGILRVQGDAPTPMCLKTASLGDLSGPAATLVLAAHGSPSNPKPAQATYAFARKLEESRLFGALQVGFVDEKPSLEEAATVTGPALLLPFFATRAGHVVIDLREAVAAAGFKGTVLPPIGVWPEVRDLVAQAVLRHDLALVV